MALPTNIEIAMPSTPKRVKYYVRVARPRIETTIIEVEASHDDEAGQRALEKAPQMPEAAWSLQPFDEAAFQSHVETMIAEDELQSHRAANRDLAAEALSEIETRYLLLMASEEEESGHLLLQPWFVWRASIRMRLQRQSG